MTVGADQRTQIIVFNGSVFKLLLFLAPASGSLFAQKGLFLPTCSLQGTNLAVRQMAQKARIRVHPTSNAYTLMRIIMLEV